MLSGRLLLLLLSFLLCFSFPVAAEDLESQARRLMNALGCKGCHSFEQSGSNLAPPLTGIGARLSLQQLQDQLISHREKNEKTLMPSYATIPAEDLNAVLQFLSERK